MSNGENVYERLFKLLATIGKLIVDNKRDPYKVADFLQRIVAEAENFSSFIVSTFKMVVNYGRSINDSVKAGHYDWVNDGVTDGNFPSTEVGNQEVGVDTGIFHFGRNISSDNAIAEMDKAGYRPATMKELLAYGENNPDEQRKFPIVALGSVVKLLGDRPVGFLYGSSGERNLDLNDYGNVWLGSGRFLAVRKVSAA